MFARISFGAECSTLFSYDRRELENKKCSCGTTLFSYDRRELENKKCSCGTKHETYRDTVSILRMSTKERWVNSERRIVDIILRWCLRVQGARWNGMSRVELGGYAYAYGYGGGGGVQDGTGCRGWNPRPALNNSRLALRGSRAQVSGLRFDDIGYSVRGE